jgi:hypothetical protein
VKELERETINEKKRKKIEIEIHKMEKNNVRPY